MTNFEDANNELQKELENERKKVNTLGLGLDVERRHVKELQDAVASLKEENFNLKINISDYENKVRDYRRRRDEDADEIASLQSMLARRSAELEHLKSDHDDTVKKLQAVILEEIKARAELDEIKVTKVELDHKKQRLIEEKSFITTQMEMLKNDLQNRHEELITIRREHVSSCLALETELEEKSDRIKVLSETEKVLTDSVRKLSAEVEELNNKLLGRNDEVQTVYQNYVQELTCKTKLIDLYKEVNEEATKKNDELVALSKKLQDMLSETTNKYEALKEEFDMKVNDHENLVNDKNSLIAELREELRNANELVENLKEGNVNEALENMLPHGGAYCDWIKSGLTITRMYTEYIHVCQQLTVMTKEKEQLQEQMQSILEELKSKVPVMKQTEDDYEEALKSLVKVRTSLDQLELEHATLKKEHEEIVYKNSSLSRNNQQLKKCTMDLSRQVCYLLNEVEQLTGKQTSLQSALSISLEYEPVEDDVISQNLVTFKNIQELQQQNLKLRSVVRSLTESYEAAEQQLKKNENSEDLLKRNEVLESSLKDLKITIERQNKLISTLQDHSKVLEMLSVQHEFGNRVDIVSSAIENFDEDGFPSQQKEVNVLHAEIQTDSDAVEGDFEQLTDELNKTRKSMDDMKKQYDSFKEEHLKHRHMLMTSLDESEERLTKLNEEYVKTLSRAETSEKQTETMKTMIDSLKEQISTLESRCEMYLNKVSNNENLIATLRNQYMDADNKRVQLEMEVSNLRINCSMLRESEARIDMERNMLLKERNNYQKLVTDIELMKTDLNRFDVEAKVNVESQLDAALKECSLLRRKLEGKKEEFDQKFESTEKMFKQLQDRLEEEKMETDKLIRTNNKFKIEIEEKERTIDKLNEHLRHASSVDNDLDAKVVHLQKELNARQKECLDTKEFLTTAKKDLESISQLSEKFEKELLTETENHKKYENEMKAKLSELFEEIAELKDKNLKLNNRVEELSNLKQASMIALNDELTDIKKKYQTTSEELSTLQKELGSMRTQLNEANHARLQAERKYSEAMSRHSNDIQDLNKQTDEIIQLKTQLNVLTTQKNTALEKLDTIQKSWNKNEDALKSEIEENINRVKHLTEENETLYKQIEEYNVRLNLVQSKFEKSIGENDLDKSTSFSTENDENYMKLITYLKEEKKIAFSKLEVLNAENMKLKSEMELVKSRLTEAHNLLEAEKKATDTSNTTAAKHAELVAKVQTLNALTDSNQMLREERNSLRVQITELKEKLDKLEVREITPLIEENKNLANQLDVTVTENTGLQKECARWKNRVTELTDKLSKYNIEELMKSLNMERENYNKTLEDLRAVKQDKSRLEDQMKKIQSSSNERISVLEKQRDSLQKMLEETKANFEKINKEHEDLKKSYSTQESACNEMKTSNAQLRLIAKKYKTQYLDMTKAMEEEKKKQAESKKTVNIEPAVNSFPSSGNIDIVSSDNDEILVAEQARLRQEGKQQIEAELTERIKRLNEQSEVNTSEINRLKTENESLKGTISAKDEKLNQLLKQARNKIMNITNTLKKTEEESDRYKQEADNYKQKSETIETATRDEYEARHNVIKSTYDNRISKMEKDKAELQAEKDRIVKELELVSQRVTALQRQLSSQQTMKPSTNVGQEKNISEPPTANIKPMAGPSSSGTKSQPSQQAVTVTPWRSVPVNETPFASVRPRSMQARTAAVLPTSQTAVSQSTVVVPPQQQLVDTSTSISNIVEAFSSSSPSSSYTDYNIPSTSSAVGHAVLRQMVVIPTLQTSQSAESTQQELDSTALDVQQPPSTTTVSQSTAVVTTLSPLLVAGVVSQSQIALVMPRIELQSSSVQNLQAYSINAEQQSVVASSQQTNAPQVSASSQSIEQLNNNNATAAQNRSSDVYYQLENDDSNQGQVSASNQTTSSTNANNNDVQQLQQRSIIVSSVENPPEQSIVIASSHQSSSSSSSSSSDNGTGSGSGNKNVAEPFMTATSSNVNTVTTTQTTSKRQRENETSTSESLTVQSQPKRVRIHHDEVFRGFHGDIDENSNDPDSLLGYRGLDVEYQVPTSSQRDQEFDNTLMADSNGEDDESAMPDDGIIEGGDDSRDYEEEPDNPDTYELEVYGRDDQDSEVPGYNVVDDPNIDEDSNQLQYQNNEAEIMTEGNNDARSRSENTNRSLPSLNDQQSSEATSSGNNSQAESSNVAIAHHQMARRSSVISPLIRQQQAQHLILNQGYDDNAGDDGIVPSTPTLFVPRRTDGFSEAVSSPRVPSVGQFLFSESSASTSRAGVAQVISEGMDDTRMDLSQLEENNIRSTGRSVPSTPPRGASIHEEIGQSEEDVEILGDERVSALQSQQIAEDVLDEAQDAPSDIELEEIENNLIEGRNESPEIAAGSEGSNDAVTSESSQHVTSRISEDEGREAEALPAPLEPEELPTRTTRSRGRRVANSTFHTRSTGMGIRDRGGSSSRGSNLGRNRRGRTWYPRY